MESTKRIALLFAVGGIIGTLLIGFLAPAMLGWYWQTPMDIGVNCKPAVEWGVDRFQKLQLGGVVVGGLTNVILFSVIFGRKPKAV